MLQSGNLQEGRTTPTAPLHICQVPLVLTGYMLLGVLLWHVISHQYTPIIPFSQKPGLTASNATQFWTYAPAGLLNNQVIMGTGRCVSAG